MSMDLKLFHELWILTFFIILVREGSSSIAEVRQAVIKNITTDYDARIPPGYESDSPITCVVQLYILSIDSISDSTMDYSMSMFVRQKWNDSRLMYQKLPGLRSLELDSKMMENIWVPDLYFLNEKKGLIHTVTVPNKLMHINPNGHIFYSMRATGTFSCNMHLQKYPLDKQICSLRLESFGYSKETLQFRWHEKAVDVSPDMTLPQFEQGKIKTYICDVNYAGVNYTCINMTMELTRKYGYYIIQVFVPSVLIVFLSWVSFWLNIDAVPARISLGLLTVLTTTTQSSGARASLPRVSYIKAIDIWMAMCLLFVFAALIEFAYVNVLARVEQRKRQTLRGGIKNADDENGGDLEFGPEKTKPRPRRFFKDSVNRERARTVDKVSRIAFPAVFIIFNIVYWITYVFWQPEALTALEL